MQFFTVRDLVHTKLVKKRYRLFFWKWYYKLYFTTSDHYELVEKEYWDSLSEDEKEAEYKFLENLSIWRWKRWIR